MDLTAIFKNPTKEICEGFFLKEGKYQGKACSNAYIKYMDEKQIIGIRFQICI